MDRRTFLRAVTVAGLGSLALPTPLMSSPATSSALRRRYAIVGVGSRHEMYQDAIEQDYPALAQLVGLCDLNPGRL